jgi:CRP-like cAMP-binding protein
MFDSWGLKGLPCGIARYVASQLVDMIVPQGAYVFREGDVVENLHILVEGKLKTTTAATDSPEVTFEECVSNPNTLPLFRPIVRWQWR